MGKRELVALLCFVFLVSRDCCVAVPHDATGLSAVYDCGISLSYSPTISKIPVCTFTLMANQQQLSL